MTAPSSRGITCTVAVATAALTAALLAGCTTDEPEAPTTSEASPTVGAEPTPEPSPTLDEAAQLKHDNIDAAKQRIIDYWAKSAEVINTKYDGWDELEQFFMPDIWKPRELSYIDAAGEGESGRGAAEVVSMAVTDYRASDGGYEHVTIDACMDFSGITQFDGDGNVVERAEDFAPRYTIEYVVAHSGPDTWWRIADSSPKPDEAC